MATAVDVAVSVDSAKMEPPVEAAAVLAATDADCTCLAAAYATSLKN